MTAGAGRVREAGGAGGGPDASELRAEALASLGDIAALAALMAAHAASGLAVDASVEGAPGQGRARVAVVTRSGAGGDQPVSEVDGAALLAAIEASASSPGATHRRDRGGCGSWRIPVPGGTVLASRMLIAGIWGPTHVVSLRLSAGTPPAARRGPTLVGGKG